MRISEIKNIDHEAEFIRERLFKTGLLEIFIGDRRGSVNERKQLKTIQAQLGGKIYMEAVYLLTNKLLPDNRKSRKTFKEIIDHRNELTRILDRPVGIQVAALDYTQNILKWLKNPLIIEEEQSSRMAESAVSSKENFGPAIIENKKRC